MNDKSFYDVIILGSGAGGSLLAGILARSGKSVVMIDRGEHPRFAIGESSTPAADFILHSLATKYNLPELLPLTCFGEWKKKYPNILCGCKRGFSYFWHGAGKQFSPGENHQRELFVTANSSREQADTQWYRPDVDHFLVDVAVKHSAKLFQNAKQLEIQHLGEHNWSVTFRQQAVSEKVQGRFIIDATGASGVLLDSLNVPLVTEQLLTNSSALYGHWDHVTPTRKWLGKFGDSCEEHPFPSDDSAVHHLFHDGWMWQLRFVNGLTSLGFVSHGGFNEKIKAGTPEQAWACLLESKPSLAGLLSQAQLARFPGHVYRSGRLQRLRACASGVDWAALPFSAGFIDPLHSTGIAHTLSGVEKLSKILVSESGQQQSNSLKKYSQCLIDELRLIDLLVAGCYESLADFSLFTAWTMLYFAAATTYEKKYQQDRCDSPGFLCAADADFVELVHQLFADLRDLPKDQSREAKQAVEGFILTMKRCLVPYNHVGLFEPEISNMYRYTSAEKH